MDIQFVSNAHGAAAYIAAYVSKGETEGLRRAAAEGLAAMPEGSTHRQLLRRIGTVHMAARETSLQVQSCCCRVKEMSECCVCAHVSHVTCFFTANVHVLVLCQVIKG